MLSRISLLALILATSAGISASATTYRVPDPYPTIQSGISAASTGDTVLVACGTYYEHDIVMKSGIILLSETGDPDCVTIDAQQEGRVLYCENIGENTLIKGFIITGGLRGLPDPGSGGGLYCVGYSSPTFDSCAIQDNHAIGGGGVYCDNYSSPTFDSCIIRDNNSFGDAGGGMLCRDYSSPTLIEVTFENNIATGPSGAPVGGLACTGSSSPRLTDCVFVGNSAAMIASAMFCDSGSPSLERVLFHGNDAAGMHLGYAMVCWSETATLIDVFFSDNTGEYALNLGGCTSATLTRVTFASNNSGGALLWGCSPTVTSCTFYDNEVGVSSRGSLHCEGASPVLERTIIAFSTWGRAISCDPSSQPVLECCNIFGNELGDWIGCIEGQYGINGNISEDPLFCDPENGDLTLHEDSPCAPFSPPNEECDLIGAWPVGCGAPTATRQTTWGQIKAAYR